MNMADNLRPYASELERRHRGCTRKTAYATRKEAARVGKVWHEHPYRCGFCGSWHLTKKGMGKGGGVRR
jgi:hypothetical protein